MDKDHVRSFIMMQLSFDHNLLLTAFTRQAVNFNFSLWCKNFEVSL